MFKHTKRTGEETQKRIYYVFIAQTIGEKRAVNPDFSEPPGPLLGKS